MKFITDNNDINIIGAKAYNLYKLESFDCQVPKWGVIVDIPILKRNSSPIDFINKWQLSVSIIDDIKNQFASNTKLAIRSSCDIEDGNKYSFAGQFSSMLNIGIDDLENAIRDVWCSLYHPSVDDYMREHNILQEPKLSIIVQEMVAPDISGVAFSYNPVTLKKECTINYTEGLADKLVSGQINGQSISVKNGKVIHQKVLQVSNHSIPYATLSDAMAKKISSTLEMLENKYEKLLDIEFAIRGEQLIMLQCRAITTARKHEEHTIWDNSNIVESYPGITLPLTFSFISSSYSKAYQNFGSYLGITDKMILRNQSVFDNTLGLLNGRVYYNLKSWYHMLAMLPGYSINARMMEKMMGVKSQFDIPKSFRMSKRKAWWQLSVMATKMMTRYIMMDKKRRIFVKEIHNTFNQYKQIQLDQKSLVELKDLYLNFEYEVLDNWKAPLLNDFFSMIWFGLLEKQCSTLSKENNLHNDLLCGSRDIISVEPIYRTMEISTLILNNEDYKNLFENYDAQIIYQQLQTNEKYQEVFRKIRSYINDFGNRCIGELKLEIPSYHEDPTLYIEILKGYVSSNLTNTQYGHSRDEQLRHDAETTASHLIGNNPIKKWWFRHITKQTRKLISNRENLRYERTKAYGIVRALFTEMGKKLQSMRIIDCTTDIFYLSKEEIIAYIEGRSINNDLSGLIALRKSEYALYECTDKPADRVETKGVVYYKNDFTIDQNIPLTGDLKGIGCSPGRVKAKARIVHSPKDISNLNGEILITTSTDPGWVTLFPSASAIIVEKGSLLSHSAIVSREMGIPCIVGVDRLLNTIKTGDLIEMDGSTGKIKIIES